MNRTLAIAVIAIAVSSAALAGSAILAQKNKKPEAQKTGAQPSPTPQRTGDAQKPQPSPTPRTGATPVTRRGGGRVIDGGTGGPCVTPRGGGSAIDGGTTGEPGCPGAKATRVTADDISRNPAGKNYVVDTTRRGGVFDFDSTSRAIDFSRIMVRTPGGNVSMEALLDQLLPSTADRSVLRIGRPKELSRGKASQIGGKINFTCTPGEACTCTGDDDCNNMFGAGVCGDIAVCNPTGCSCLPPIKN